MTPALLLASLASLACQVPEADDGLGSDTETGSDTESDGSTDGTTGDGVECECIAEQDVEELPVFPTCGAPLCDPVVWYDDEEGFSQLESVEAAECSLIALRDRTPGIVRWSSASGDGQFTNDGYVLIYADGSAVVRQWGNKDLVYEAGDAVHFELPEPAYYDDCLAMMNYSCIGTGPHPSNEIVALETCVEGWSHGTF
jgi:hypothetical protein